MFLETRYHIVVKKKKTITKASGNGRDQAFFQNCVM